MLQGASPGCRSQQNRNTYTTDTFKECCVNISLLCDGKKILSKSGVQQGDPIDPLLFCLSTIPFQRNLKSSLSISYLNDDALGGDPADVLCDLQTISNGSRSIGMMLNIRKCKLFVMGGAAQDHNHVKEMFLQLFPEMTVTDPGKLDYLGSSLLDGGIPDAFAKQSLHSYRPA